MIFIFINLFFKIKIKIKLIKLFYLKKPRSSIVDALGRACEQDDKATREMDGDVQLLPPAIHKPHEYLLLLLLLL